MLKLPITLKSAGGLTSLFAFAAFFAVQDAVAVTAQAETAIAVDVRADVCRAVGEAGIGYSPKWGGVTNAGAYVVLQKVVGGVTNTVATFAADAESSYAYGQGENDPCFVKLIHRVYSLEGVEIGEPLVCELSFGRKSAAGQPFGADSRADALQEAVSARDPVSLAYSTAWAGNAASVSIKAVKLSGMGGEPVGTNCMFSAAADAEGVTPMHGVGRGWWRLLCEVSDGQGDVLLSYLTGEFEKKGGFLMILR